MKFTINIKGRPDPKNGQLVKLDFVFYRGHHPRVTKVIDITGPYKDWNPKDQCFNGRSSDVKAKNQKLLDLMMKYTKVAEDWNAEAVEWSPVQLSHYFDKAKTKKSQPLRIMSVSQYFDYLIQQKKDSKRVKNGKTFSCSGTAALYQNLKNCLVKFTVDTYDRSFSSYFFSDIDEQFIKEFVYYIKIEGAKSGNKGGLRNKLKCLYGTFYYAGREGLPGTDLSVFNCVEQQKKDQDVQPQTLPYWVIQQMEKLDQSLFTKTEQMHIDYFLFCFYCGGMAPVDAAFITYDCLIKNGMNTFLRYERKKFPKYATPPYTTSARRIVDKYKDKCSQNYMLPIFSEKHKTELQLKRRMENLCIAVNHTLVKVAKVIGYPEEFTWYACRGTFITRMLDIGVKPEKVAEMSGNSVQTIFKYYFKNTSPDELYEAVEAAI